MKAISPPTTQTSSTGADSLIDIFDARAIAPEPFDEDEIEFWALCDPNDPTLVDESASVIEACCARLSRRLGAASLRAVRLLLDSELTGARRRYRPARGPFERFATSIAKRIIRDYEARNKKFFWREKADELRRKAAAASQGELVKYLDHIRAMTHAFLAGKLSNERSHCEEIAAEAVVRALETFRRDEWHQFERVGKPAYWQLLNQVLNNHRRIDRQFARLRKAPRERISPVAVRPDDALIALEAQRRWRSLLLDDLPRHLTKAQRRALGAAAEEAIEGPLRGLVTRVGTRLNRNKAQATRAMQRIRSTAESLGAEEFLDEVAR